ncbi:MAG TPA: hypothetical protein VFI37_14520 [Gaiellaceae bacterium]|jgi:hypothetical protein|nr:hypothetical protein [Gaiellaceae bacterium]
MADVTSRLNVTLDRERAEKLRRLAEQSYMPDGTLARALLSRAIDESELDSVAMGDLLDGIPGAFERAQLGREQGLRGETVPLDEL